MIKMLPSDSSQKLETLHKEWPEEAIKPLPPIEQGIDIADDIIPASMK